MWDMKGPHQISPELAGSKEILQECPMMSPNDRIFDSSAGLWELSGENTDIGSSVEPWFNETLTLDAYVRGSMDLGCQCSLRHDSQRYYPECEKMLVAGDFLSERRWDEPQAAGLSFLEILRYMGGGVVLPFVVPGIYCLCRQRSRKIRVVINFFEDWVQRGIVQRVSFFPGSKHTQGRLTLHLPPTNNAMNTNPN